jgi:hypothetical protein
VEFTALDGSKILALMLAGGAFALAGLWLMFRPKPEGGAARLELFGMKFESSSAGLLVFLIGAGFIATPLVVDERPPTRPRSTPAGSAAAPAPGEEATQPASGQRAVILPATAGAEEREPNNFVSEANQIAPNLFYSGEVRFDRDDAEDWFVVPLGDGLGAEFTVQMRNRDKAGYDTCAFDILNDKEEHIETVTFPGEGLANHTEVYAGNTDHIFLRVRQRFADGPSRPSISFCKYEAKVY